MTEPTTLHIQQKLTLMVNQYWIRTADPAGNPGDVLAYAQQKRMKLREEVTFYSDDSKTRVLFGFKSRQVIDMAATTDVFDADHMPIGVFRKDAVKSSQLDLAHPEWTGHGDGRERSQNVAVFRRFSGFIPIVGDVLG